MILDNLTSCSSCKTWLDTHSHSLNAQSSVCCAKPDLTPKNTNTHASCLLSDPQLAALKGQGPLSKLRKSKDNTTNAHIVSHTPIFVFVSEREGEETDQQFTSSSSFLKETSLLNPSPPDLHTTLTYIWPITHWVSHTHIRVLVAKRRKQTQIKPVFRQSMATWPVLLQTRTDDKRLSLSDQTWWRETRDYTLRCPNVWFWFACVYFSSIKNLYIISHFTKQNMLHIQYMHDWQRIQFTILVSLTHACNPHSPCSPGAFSDIYRHLISST